MGNINRRPSSSRTTAQSSAQWDEANVLRLISENKLAPKHTDKLSTAGRELTECPICFLEFPILNTVHCCKQSICTDCVVQLKSAEGKGACPFCGNAEMQVSLIPSVGKRINSMNTGTPSRGKDRSGSLSSDADAPSSGRNSAAGSVSGPSALTYLTPEQDKRLRSYSLDAATSLNSSSGGGAAASGTGTAPSSGGSAPVVARKADREALERQIREQRLHFDDRDLAEAAARTTNRRGGPHYQSSSGFGLTAQYRLQQQQQLQQQQLRAARYRLGGGGAAEATAGSSSGVLDSPAASYMGVIEGLLQRRGGTEGISSLQQLEDIMLMEAIRLSMQDAPPQEETGASMGPSTTDSTVSGPLSAPIARQGSGTGAGGGALGGAGSQSTTEANSSTASAQASPAQTGSCVAPGTATAVRTRGGRGNRYFYGIDEYDDEDGDEGDDQDDADQLYGDYNGEEGEGEEEEGEEGEGEGEGYRESDLLSDEDEQLRLAMALSLSSLRVEQQQQQQLQQQEQQQSQEVNTQTSGAADMRASEVDSSGKNTPSGVKSDDTRPAQATTTTTTAAPASVEEPPSPAPNPCFSLSVLDPLGLFSSPLTLGADEGSTTDAAGTKLAVSGSGAASSNSNRRDTAEGPVLKMPADDTAA